MAGRPIALDDITSRRICNALLKGASRTAAAESAGVAIRTMAYWLARGRDGEQPFLQFLQSVAKAEAHAEVQVSDKLYELAVQGDKACLALWLERRRPLEWGKRDVTAVDEEARAESSGDSDLAVVESVAAALKSRKASA